ncbi:MAG: Na+/H+ antiporter subunit E [Burkholderiaceae bacterium]|nr:Na+/H+ antiporter subunit E [Burkholderiaceae bacterium]
MKRWLPAPLLSLALLAVWLLLNRSFSLGQILFGTLLALAIPWLTAGLRPQPVRMRRPGVALRLLLCVALDSVQSSLVLARRLLWPGPGRHPAGFVQVPLDLRDPNGLATLAMIVCLTPGTAWAELAVDGRTLLLHVLELDDAAALSAEIKHRYERPLMEIFE